MIPVWIFANPIAGRGQALPLAQELVRRITQAGMTADLFIEPPHTIPNERLLHEAQAAVVIGGDGTLRAVAQRLYGTEHSAPSLPRPPLLPIALGTANLMDRHLNAGAPTVGDPLLRAMTLLRNGRVRRLDAALANGQLSLLMAHVGFDAHVVHELARIRRGPIAKSSYIVPSFLALARHTFPRLRVHVDDHDLFNGRGMVFIANIPEYGTGFPLVPHARGDDGLLDVSCVQCDNRRQIINFFLHAAARTHSQLHRLTLGQGKYIRVQAEPPAHVQIDGDPGGFTPLEVNVLPTRVPFLTR